MKPGLDKILLTLLFFITLTHADAQTFVEKLRLEGAEVFAKCKVIEPFERVVGRDITEFDHLYGKVDVINLSPKINSAILLSQDKFLNLSIPISGGKEVAVHLKEVEIHAEGFRITNSKDEEVLQDISSKFYWGYAEGFEQSTVVINVFDGQISGTLDLGNDTYTIGKLNNTAEHVVYKESDSNIHNEMSCGADQLPKLKEEVKEQVDRNSRDANNCVNIYFELDHDFYNRYGNIPDAYQYLVSVFSQVRILYNNENIQVRIQEVKVWDEEDPYPGSSTLSFLNQFRNSVGSNFNGTLAHLVGTQGGGGIAYVDVVCVKSYAHGYSVMDPNYNNVPQFSNAVNILTHELGHNLGSPHTHSCNWNNDNSQIDDCGNVYLANAGESPEPCYDSQSPIIPSGGGTIMSYCHLNSVGVDFNLGFGTQPGNLIRDKVHNGSCLSACVDCNLVGQSCDDNNPCTENDTYDEYCICMGTPLPDQDNDGVCGDADPDDTDPCNPNGLLDGTLTTLTIVMDQYPQEVSWKIVDSNDVVVASKAGYTGAGQTYTELVCLKDGCYTFTIEDSYGDGICCGQGNGSYSLTDPNNNVLASGGQYTTSEDTEFCYDFYGCPDADEDNICDNVDPCYDPMMMMVNDVLDSGNYNARGEIVIDSGASIPENAVITLNAPVIRISSMVVIPDNTNIEFNDEPCNN